MPFKYTELCSKNMIGICIITYSHDYVYTVTSIIYIICTCSTRLNRGQRKQFVSLREIRKTGKYPPLNPTDSVHFHRFQHFFLLCSQNLAPLIFFLFFPTPAAFCLSHLKHHTDAPRHTHGHTHKCTKTLSVFDSLFSSLRVCSLNKALLVRMKCVLRRKNREEGAGRVSYSCCDSSDCGTKHFPVWCCR